MIEFPTMYPPDLENIVRNQSVDDLNSLNAESVFQQIVPWINSALDEVLTRIETKNLTDSDKLFIDISLPLVLRLHQLLKGTTIGTCADVVLEKMSSCTKAWVMKST